MAITKRGLGWELLQSAWVLVPPASVGMLVWAAFLYAGIRARHRPWLVAAAVYFLGFASALALTDNSDNWTGLIVVALWFVGTVHAFIVRPEFLIRLDADLSADAARSSPAPPIRRIVPVDATYAPFTPPAAPSPSAPPVSPPVPAAPQPSAPVDLNAAPEPAIAALPGVGPILARRAVELRDARGGFASVDDFADALDLKPHILERIRPLAFTTPRAAPPRPMGRRVDY
ncbi:helix-hairpin-helix domain-containing protein [Longimicrobium sp.]|jgi:pyruvate/2-oxoglutarate dehydrogenase complex dihydrolipoamide acyltransferase (E2) component|uniref:ComEA family DNA-binding protein n=1 Tax=Longimicrobium sp. TaxID=2029185 RepID=UPI002F949CC0